MLKLVDAVVVMFENIFGFQWNKLSKREKMQLTRREVQPNLIFLLKNMIWVCFTSSFVIYVLERNANDRILWELIAIIVTML